MERTYQSNRPMPLNALIESQGGRFIPTGVVINHLLPCLDLETVYHLSQMGKKWHHICSQSNIVSMLCEKLSSSDDALLHKFLTNKTMTFQDYLQLTAIEAKFQIELFPSPYRHSFKINHTNQLTAIRSTGVIQELTIDIFNITNNDCMQLAHLTALRTLKIQHATMTDVDLWALSSLTQLHLINVNANESTLASIAGLTSLKHLSCPGVTNSNLRSFGGLTNLQSLNLPNANVNAAGLRVFSRFSSLQTLNLAGYKHPYCDAQVLLDVGQLTEIPHLRHLNIGKQNHYHDNSQYTNERDMQLSRLTNLHSLDLSECNLSNGESLRSLRGLTQLRSLNLYHTGVTDAGMRYLSNLTALQELNLRTSAITGDSLRLLSCLPYLTTLDIVDCNRINPRDLENLKPCLSLKQIKYYIP